MTRSRLLSVAQSQRGQGWLGAMEILDVLEKLNLPIDREQDLRNSMESEFGRIILGGTIGCDEAAMQAACSQCIESVIASETLNANHGSRATVL